jgi:diacylglycerol kinase (ATP)
LSRLLFRSQLEFLSPKSMTELFEECRKAAKENIDVIISVGGDGTFHTLLQHLADSQTIFLVVPAGTANDLATELGISRKLKKAVECIRRDQYKEIDLISINGHLMATNGGIGLVGEVAHDINQWRKNIFGFRSLMAKTRHHIYSGVLSTHLITNQVVYRQVELTLDNGEVREISTPLLLVNNQPKIGGSFSVAPDTRNDDGSFNVLYFTHAKRLALLEAILKVKRGKSVASDRNVVSFETTSLKIRSLGDSKPLRFFGDGEQIALDSTLDITIRPKALRVFSPRCGLVERISPDGPSQRWNTV